MVASGVRCVLAACILGAPRAAAASARACTSGTCKPHGKAATAMLQVTSTGANNTTEEAEQPSNVTEDGARPQDSEWWPYLKAVLTGNASGEAESSSTSDENAGGANVTSNSTGNEETENTTAQLQYVAKKATMSALEKRLMEDPFVEGWKVFTGCASGCANTGGESLDCAHECLEKQEPGMRDAFREKLDIHPTPPPTPHPTASPTTIKQGCAGDDGCLWQKCCRKYNAFCLACTVDMTVPEFCESHVTLDVPGCTQAFLEEIVKLRGNGK